MPLTPKQARKIAKKLQGREVFDHDRIDLVEVLHATGKVLFKSHWPHRPKLKQFLAQHYNFVGGGNTARQPGGLSSADAQMWTRVDAVNRALVGSGLLDPSFDTDRIELFFPELDPTSQLDSLDSDEQAFIQLIGSIYEKGAIGILGPDMDIVQPNKSLADTAKHKAARRARIKASRTRLDAGPPNGYDVLTYGGDAWIAIGDDGPVSPCVFRTCEEATEHAWELVEGRTDPLLRSMTGVRTAFDRDSAVERLRAMATSEPSTETERKIHACKYPGGVLVLCQDGDTEVIAELSPDGPGSLSVDGIDVTDLVEADDPDEIQRRLSEVQIKALAAVMEAAVDLDDGEVHLSN